MSAFRSVARRQHIMLHGRLAPVPSTHFNERYSTFNSFYNKSLNKFLDEEMSYKLKMKVENQSTKADRLLCCIVFKGPVSRTRLVKF